MNDDNPWYQPIFEIVDVHHHEVTRFNNPCTKRMIVLNNDIHSNQNCYFLIEKTILFQYFSEKRSLRTHQKVVPRMKQKEMYKIKQKEMYKIFTFCYLPHYFLLSINQLKQ